MGLAVLGLSGCVGGTYTGGGWTSSPADPDQKAIFAGTFEAVDEDGDGSVFALFEGFDPDDSFKGQFQYVDRASAVAFHGVIDGGYYMNDEQGGCLFPCDLPQYYNIPGSIYFEGSYTPIPKNSGEPGRFQVLVGPGLTGEDQIWVACVGGVLDGYTTDADVAAGGVAFDDDVIGQFLQMGKINVKEAE